MNKVIKLFIIGIIFLTAGCSKEKYKKCTIDLYNKIQNYHQESVYKIYYEKNFVTRIEKEDTYISKSNDVLDYFNEYKNLEYQKLNRLYKGYTYNVIKTGDKIKVIATIDMSAIDIKEMILDDYLDSDYIKNNRLTLIGAKYFYTSKGAECDI